MPRARKIEITIAPGQIWKPKRGNLWAKVERVREDGRIAVEKYMPSGDYSGLGAITGPHKVDIEERSLRDHYTLDGSDQ
jgi:hypothetical protein